MRINLRIVIGKLSAATLLLVLAHVPASAQSRSVSPVAPRIVSRIVAIGDVHGSLPPFVSLLELMKLVDPKRGDKGDWNGGQTTFVQTGDIVDGGPQSRACLDFLMNLERTAQKQKKGQVIFLLGDHEIMGMTGDLRYVSREDFQSFATKQSEKVRQAAYREYENFLAERKRAGVAPAQPISEQEWMAEHPAGYFERREAFGPQGAYGRWLRQHGIAYQEGGGVFVHAGLSPNSTFASIDELNAQMHGALLAFDRGWQSLASAGIIWRYMSIDEAIVEIQRERAAIPLRETDDPKRREELDKFIELLNWLRSPDHPAWYSGLAEEPETLLAPSLQVMMTRLKISFIVAGHLAAPGAVIRQRFDNRVFLIDTAMADSSGRASALEIAGGRFVARTPGEAPRDLLAPGTHPDSNPAGTAAEQP